MSHSFMAWPVWCLHSLCFVWTLAKSVFLCEFFSYSVSFPQPQFLVSTSTEKCGMLDSFIRGRRLMRRRNKNTCIFVPNDAMWRFHDQASINCLVARCQKHCWSVPHPFSHTVSVHKISSRS